MDKALTLPAALKLLDEIVEEVRHWPEWPDVGGIGRLEQVRAAVLAAQPPEAIPTEEEFMVAVLKLFRGRAHPGVVREAYQAIRAPSL